MILYEFEGKKLLKEAGIKVPKSILLDSGVTVLPRMTIKFPVVLKAQVLSGKRKDAGGIKIVDREQGTGNSLKELFSKTINKEKVEKVLIEEMVEIDKEYYVSISYDTDSRGPILTISSEGGTGIEERKVKKYLIDPLTQTVILASETRPGSLDSHSSLSDEALTSESKTGVAKAPQNNISKETLERLINLFFDQDLLLLEINPLVKTKKGIWIALDAKIKLDDTAIKRHEDWNFPPRSAPGHTPNEREIAAKKIDEEDYRGTAGSTYFDLNGDIAIMTSGGGGSLTAMDTLYRVGGKPANYTEYSGNPPREKVEKLTEIVLSKPGLHGLWVVGALANLTDIYETLSGFIEGLRNVRKNTGLKLDFPIVIRRAGPKDKEAFDMLKKVKDFDLHLYSTETSISKSAEIMVELAKKYASSK